MHVKLPKDVCTASFSSSPVCCGIVNYLTALFYGVPEGLHVPPTRPPLEEGILESQPPRQRSIIESPYEVVDQEEARALRERRERERKEREEKARSVAVKQPVFTEEEVSGWRSVSDLISSSFAC